MGIRVYKISYLLLLIILLAGGCRQVLYLAMSPLPDYGRWKYKDGWHTESSSSVPSTQIALHHTSRDRLFPEIYRGYAIIKGQLVGICFDTNGFRICAPWEKEKNSPLLEDSHITIHNEREFPKDILGIYTQDNGCVEIRSSMLTPPVKDEGSFGGNPEVKKSYLLFNKQNIRLELRASKLKVYSNNENIQVVDLPLPGILKASATHHRIDGRELLFILIKQRGLINRYALVVIEDDFQCLEFYVFPDDICETPFFVKNNQGELYIVPLNALLSIDEGIFEIKL